MNVKEMMTSQVYTCSPTTPLNSVAMTMWNNDCGAVPVVDDQQNPIAMITDRDIAMGAALQKKPLWELNARDITDSQQLYKCETETDIEQALDLMREHSVRRLPVVNSQGKLAGIVTSGDIIARSNSADDAELPFYRTEGMLKAVTGHHAPMPLTV
jgi:CBS domain-containing protein